MPLAAPPSDSAQRQTDETRLREASVRLGVPFVRLAARPIADRVLKYLPEEVARTHQMVAYEETELASGKKVLRLAVADPDLLEKDAPDVITELHAKQGMLIEVALATRVDIENVLTRYRPVIVPAPIVASVAPPLPPPTHAALEPSDQPVVAPVHQQAARPPAKSIDLTHRTISRDVLERIPEETAKKYRVVVFDKADETISLAAEQPDNPQLQELLAFIREQNHLRVDLYQTTPASIDAALVQYNPPQEMSKVTEMNVPHQPKPTTIETTKPTERREPPVVDQPKKSADHLTDHQTTDKKDAHSPAPHASSQAVDHKQAALTNKITRTLSAPTHADHKPAHVTLDSKPHPYSDKQRSKAPSKEQSIADLAAHTEPEKPAAPVPTIHAEDLTTPDLLVPKSETTSLLVSMDGDVESDLLAIVGQEITTGTQLEAIVKTGFIPKIVGAMLLYAVHKGASDIHLQADDKDLVLRNRVDGILQDILKMPVTLQAPIVSRIKILSKLKIDEQRVPQDGRFEVMAGKKQVDLRVSTFPTVRGEKVVIRLLDKTTGLLKLPAMGLSGTRLERLEHEYRKPYGVILATGPTGSGKTTTLYAVLQEIASAKVNVVTLEDPVEYEIPGINQAQIKPKIGFGFAEGLRSILRQDPNIIMVGEIRDLETASMMTQSALTGHLVLSTLHTNDAAGALPRLVNMGVEPFLITSAMNAVIAQRLVRRLCESCRVPAKTPDSVIAEIKSRLSEGNQAELTDRLTKEFTLYEAKGCDKCGDDGFKGRIGIYEVLIMSDAIEELVVKQAPASEIAALAVTEGMVTMEQDGLVKALNGMTTLEEVWRVTKAE